MEAKNLFQQLNLTHIIIAIIVAAAVLGFGAMNYISSEKNRQLQQLKILQENEAKNQQLKQTENEKTSKQEALDSCLTDARDTYDESWYVECKSQGLLSNACISLHDMTYDEYVEQNNLPSKKDDVVQYYVGMTEFETKISDCSCRLPQYNADANDRRWEDAKELCAKLYGN